MFVLFISHNRLTEAFAKHRIILAMDFYVGLSFDLRHYPYKLIYALDTVAYKIFFEALFAHKG